MWIVLSIHRALRIPPCKISTNACSSAASSYVRGRSSSLEEASAPLLDVSARTSSRESGVPIPSLSMLPMPMPSVVATPNASSGTCAAANESRHADASLVIVDAKLLAHGGYRFVILNHRNKLRAWCIACEPVLLVRELAPWGLPALAGSEAAERRRARAWSRIGPRTGERRRRVQRECAALGASRLPRGGGHALALRPQHNGRPPARRPERGDT